MTTHAMLITAAATGGAVLFNKAVLAFVSLLHRLPPRNWLRRVLTYELWSDR
jgi:hypothetical protein